MKMPALGESVTEGTVTRWLKQVGDTIEVDEPLLEVSTDKVDTEIPSPVAGTVLEIKVPGGRDRRRRRRPRDHRHPGQRPGRSPGPAAADAAAGPRQQAPQQQAPAPQQEAPAAAAPAPQQRPSRWIESKPAPRAGRRVLRRPVPRGRDRRRPGRRRSAVRPGRPAAPAAETVKANGAGDAGYVTPLVRKLAAEKGVDLSALTGTGVGGRIRKQDVIEAADKAAAAKAAARQARPRPQRPRRRRSRRRTPKPAPSPLRGRTEKLTRTRATIARRMVESLQISAQLTTVVEVDVTKIAQLRQQGQGRLPGQERREAHLPAVLRPGRGRGAAPAPGGQLVHRPGGRHGHLPRRRAPGHRGGHRRRA